MAGAPISSAALQDDPSTTPVRATAATEPGTVTRSAILNQILMLVRQPSRARATLRKRHLYVVTTILLALLCLTWTVWLMVLTASPTATVNRVMGTSDLDFGSFWRLSESPKAVKGVGVAGLVGVVLGYVVVLRRIVVIALAPNEKHHEGPKLMRTSYSSTAKVSVSVIRSGAERTLDSQRLASALARSASQLAIDVLDRESKTRRAMHVLIKTADLAIQCVSLAQLMAEGMPVALIGVFAATVALNALCTAVLMVLPYDNLGRPQLLADTAFDFVVAMAFPALVLVYALTSFTFDRVLMAINTQVFSPGFFESQASLVADPIEVTIVRHTLDSLRIDSVAKIFTRVGTSAALCRRFFGLAELLSAERAMPSLYPRGKRSLAACCVGLAVAVVVVTTGSIQTSSSACAMHPECVQITRRWVAGRDENDPTQCPCLAMIDRNIAIATFDEWEKPIDRTEKLAQLASTGDLRTLQLVNRALPNFPEELRRCKNLKHLALFYTETQTLPDWFAQFTKLEFMHFEGKSPFQSFQQLPDGLFDNMHELTYIHLAVQGLRRLPSFDGLTNLRTLTLGALLFLPELPSFDRLQNLERLTIAALLSADVLPDLTNVRDLRSLVVADRGTFCCNGFLGPDKCDLSRSLCQAYYLGLPAVAECLPPSRVASPATRAYFDKFALTACQGEAARAGDMKLAPTKDEMAQCNGRMYRVCEPSGAPPGTIGMCYNSRWMAIACDSSPYPIEMRRRQIAQGRGTPCDPEYEAWLGCRAP